MTSLNRSVFALDLSDYSRRDELQKRLHDEIFAREGISLSDDTLRAAIVALGVGIEPCGCRRMCGDDGDIDGPGTCKGLPREGR